MARETVSARMVPGRSQFLLPDSAIGPITSVYMDEEAVRRQTGSSRCRTGELRTRRSWLGPAAGSLSGMLRLIDVRGRDTQGLAAMLPVPTRLSEDLHDRVARVVEQVRRRGDAAVRELSASFGDEVPEQFSVSATEIEKATVTVGEELMSAMREAADQIRSFHRSRMPSGDVFRSGGIEVETRFVPVRKAGCYVPGGRAAYPSTVLMTAIPARVAGVDEVVVCVPPGSGGKVPAVTLAACAVAGVDAVFAIGGAQAVAAMAFGTETVPAVDVVVGPGNRWVAEAKRQVAGVVGVPAAYAGPSEIVVVADDSAPPLWVAVDLAVQAEHGPDGMAWLVTWDESVSSRVAEELAAVVRDSPRRAEIESTLAHNGVAVLVDGPEQALAVVEAVAPEHLQLMTRDASDLAERGAQRRRRLLRQPRSRCTGRLPGRPVARAAHRQIRTLCSGAHRG
ncbi:MAG: hypothetical protein KatS3mg008_0108 [Acidimicrobiales bacterium]|nr:MAG: hypothetical protein KatS3mg008_0108 [Acidimicrobiales bacterium]